MFHFCLPVVEWTVEVLSFLLDQDFLTWIPGTRYQSAELYVLQSGIFYPIRHGANDSRIACGEGSFQQDANIRRLLLYLPVLLRELKRRLRSVQQMQSETGFFPQMHSVPTHAARREAVAQLFHLSQQFLRVSRLQSQRVTQQQWVCGGFVP